MNKKVLFNVLLFILFLVSPLMAAELNYKLDDQQVVIRLQLNQKVTHFTQSLKGKQAVVEFKTAEEVDVSQEFWGVPLAKVSSLQEGKTVKIIFEFIHTAVNPKVKVGNNGIDFHISFTSQTEKGYSGGNVYLRLVVGLCVVIAFILIFYGIMKVFFKKNISTEIPGVGRGLGKVDLLPGKSLFFYELGNFIYIMGITGDSIQLIDKISDEDEINQIKAGFSRKKDFSSYLKFFSKSDMNEDVDITSTIIRDKVDSLKKK